MKIIKFVATRCQILRLKYTKFNFGWGLCPRPRWGSLSAPPDSLAAVGGSTSKGRGRGKGRGGEGRGWEGEREGRGRRGGKGGEGRKGRKRGRGREGSPPLLADHFNH